jgi:Domain of unknown function (DUF4349)
MHTRRVFIFISMLILLLAACSQKEKIVTQVVKEVVQQTAVVNKVVTKEVEKVVEAEKVVKETVVLKPQGASAAGASQSGKQTGATGEVAMLNYQTSNVRMVIKDAELQLLVENTDRAIDQVTQLAADYGGYLLSSESWFDGEFKYATIRLAVPSDNFETALTNLRHFSIQVIKETGSGQDVSAEYTDLQSRLTNLEATAARVREFLNAAKTVEESLQVNQQLSDLEFQIEQIKGQMKFYEGRAAFSTITADLVPQRPTSTPSPTPTVTPSPTSTSTPTTTATPTPKPRWNPGKTVNSATDVLGVLFRTTVDLLIWLIIVFGPFLLVLILILLVLDRLFHLRARLRKNQFIPPPRPTVFDLSTLPAQNKPGEQAKPADQPAEETPNT